MSNAGFIIGVITTIILGLPVAFLVGYLSTFGLVGGDMVMPAWLGSGFIFTILLFMLLEE